MARGHAWGIAAAVALVVVGAAVPLSARSDDSADRGSSPLPSFKMIGTGFPGGQLLQDVLDVTSWRTTQHVGNFSYVPEALPPGTTRLLIGGDGEATLDTYHADGSGLIAVVAFSSGPSAVCGRARGMRLPCLREGLTGASEVGAFRHVAVYLSTADGSPPVSSDAAVRAAAEFWSAVRFVPISHASWYGSLLTRARALTAG
jgi:hypothetical protein